MIHQYINVYENSLMTDSPIKMGRVHSLAFHTAAQGSYFQTSNRNANNKDLIAIMALGLDDYGINHFE